MIASGIGIGTGTGIGGMVFGSRMTLIIGLVTYIEFGSRRGRIKIVGIELGSRMRVGGGGP